MNMYVSNLSFHTTDAGLKKLLEESAAVSSAKVITARGTGRRRGFGFVEMDSNDDANKAIKGLNGKDLEGRSMSVSEAREKAPRSDNRRY